MAEQKPLQFSYGGQAVIEGVMMRGRYIAAVAARKPNHKQISAELAETSGPCAATVAGNAVLVAGVRIVGPYSGAIETTEVQGGIEVKEIPLNATLYRGRIARWPFVRGLVTLWDSLGLGTRALLWSSDVALSEEEDVDFSMESAAGMGLVVVSLSMGIGLFFVLPAALSAGVREATGMDSRLLADAVEGLIKLSLLVGYIWGIGQMNDVKRLFGYHGAEHKTINAYEAGAELTPETVNTYPIEHPRCGTAFLLTLVVLSVIIHMITGRPSNIFLLLLSRIGLIFPIAGIAYEFIRFTAKHLDNPIVRLITKPNLALQHLTTREPDLSMCEVGIAALEHVLAAERAAQPVAQTAPASVPATDMPVAAAD
ncbi:MAG TPA: DUF1385 domain-containing protein [Aggregatilinea sp.]|uniref:DUF1385 domain-containing protein n=1 Tax=Aggregatilinea sp. TaxID=2806333 RepID=UPI002B956DC2|nr:DUF1385 domain-containing protein [Aggregatilinea sp.]HML23475.1 DUF1385 domain-containing protein [Aggregatilinea sp.]